MLPTLGIILCAQLADFDLTLAAWRSPMNSSWAIDKIVATRLGNDTAVSMAALQNGLGGVYYDVDSHDVADQFATNAVDIVNLKGGNPNNVHDAVIYSTSTGLSRAIRGTGSPHAVTASSIGNSGWSSATMLRSGDDGSNQLLVGLGASGAVIRLMEWNPSSNQFQNASSFSISGTGTVRDVAVYDHDNDGDAEIAVLTTSGLTIYDKSGSSVDSWSQSAPEGLLAVSQGTTPILIWESVSSGGTATVTTLCSAGRTTALTLSDPSQTLTPVSWDGAANQGFLRMHSNSNDLGTGRIYTRTTTLPGDSTAFLTVFTNPTDDQVDLDYPCYTPTAVISAMCADVDNDGDEDVMLVEQYPGDSAIKGFINQVVEEADDYITMDTFYTPTPVGSQEQVSVVLADIPSGYTHLKVHVYCEEGGYPGSMEFKGTLTPIAITGSTMGFPITYASGRGTSDILWLYFTPVVMSGGDELGRGPTSSFAYSESSTSWGEVAQSFPDNCEDDPCTSGATVSGTRGGCAGETGGG